MHTGHRYRIKEFVFWTRDDSVWILAISLFPCTQCGDDLAIGVTAGHRSTVRLAAGRYSLRLHGPAIGEARIGYALTRRPEPGES